VAEKLWVGVITETITRVVAVQANTREEAAYQLDNDLVKHELQEFSEERSRRITCELTKTRKKRTKKLESPDE
jgi:hypothetical protein